MRRIALSCVSVRVAWVISCVTWDDVAILSAVVLCTKKFFRFTGTLVNHPHLSIITSSTAAECASELILITDIVTSCGGFAWRCCGSMDRLTRHAMHANVEWGRMCNSGGRGRGQQPREQRTTTTLRRKAWACLPHRVRVLSSKRRAAGWEPRSGIGRRHPHQAR